MRHLVRLLIATAAVGVALCAQSATYNATTDYDRYPTSGKITMHEHASHGISSLDQLVRFSPLIIEATVVSNLRSFPVEPRRPIDVETHSVVLVDDVLKGAIPGRSPTIIVAQAGGKIGDLEVVVTEAPVVAPKERYVLFLTPDYRKVPDDTSGLPRYRVEGIWAGLMNIGPDKIVRVSAASEALAQDVGKPTRDQLRDKIDRKVKGKDVSQDKTLPIHPGGPRRR